jgi:glycosyltransferase involved in cell wall biosynthesis
VSAPSPVLSVLIPCWNAEGSIERAIGSVLEERSVALECVVVDDGSTDRTVEVVRAVAASDPRVVLIALPANDGVSNARNRGLEMVRGEWLTLLDADDRFMPGGLGRLARAALDSDALAVVGQQVWSDGRRRWLAPRYDIPDIRRPGRKSLAASPGLLYYASPHAKLLHRSAWHGLTFSGRVLGDQPWIIRALIRSGDRIEVLGETVYEWYRPSPRRDGSSITATTRASVARGIEAIGVAREALASVRDEADTRLDEADRERILGAYVARLLGSDIAAHVSSALGRTDPGIAELFDAIGSFLEGLPARYLGGSDALARDIVEPPLRRWHRVHPAARAAYWRLFDTALRIDPMLARHGANPPARIALRLLSRSRTRLARAAAIGVLLAVRLSWGAGVLVRRGADAVRRVDGGPRG